MFLGSISFVLIGLGLDLVCGIVGALAWAKLAWAMPLLSRYRERETLRVQMEIADQAIHNLEFKLKTFGRLDLSQPGDGAAAKERISVEDRHS